MEHMIIPLSKRIIDSTGLVYNRLTALYPVVSLPENPKRRRVKWMCECECGNMTMVDSTALRTGTVRSCGCLKTEMWNKARTKHGKHGTPEYSAWLGLRKRCNNPNGTKYQNYGGRGIVVCERWDSFENFLSDMGERPSAKHSVDRIDNDGNYCPENCRWATMKEQSRNKTTTRLIEFDGRSMCAVDWGDYLGIRHATITQRLHRGWSVEDTLTRNPNRGKGTYKYHK